MISSRRQPQYLDLILLMHLDDPVLASLQPARHSGWLIAMLVLLVVLLIFLGFNAVPAFT